jgi:hypothetical protein
MQSVILAAKASQRYSLKGTKPAIMRICFYQALNKNERLLIVARPQLTDDLGNLRTSLLRRQ